MRIHSHLKTAALILGRYKGEEPFASYLKKFFKTDKKYGSKDRKTISHLCYCFSRLGKSLTEISTEERILIGLFLCSTEPNEMLEQLKPEWNKKISLPVKEKLLIINYSLLIPDVFPWKEELSDGIDHKKFCESFFVQTDLFLRLRPGYEKTVKTKLTSAGIKFSEVNSTCLALANATKIETIIELDKVAVVQDLNSQKIGDFLPVRPGRSDRVWDCCAGSGGKSLLAFDMIPNADLTVSDSRESIIRNLKKRFKSAGIKKYNSFIADLATSHSPLTIHHSPFDLIICDAPCTGSGTWSRTPEQFYFFDKKKIEQYSSLQKKIISNTIPYLKPTGYFLYITCSVFKKENEENVDLVKNEFHLELVKMELLKGYDKKADSLFVALFRKDNS